MEQPSPSAHTGANSSDILPFAKKIFMFHNSEALPRSRQSSVDFPMTSTLSSMSVSGPWTDDSSYGSMPHSEERQRAQSSRRSSVFNLRSRSNTNLSTSSSSLSLGTFNMAQSDSSRPESPLPFASFGRQGQSEASGSRKSLFRGKKGTRMSGSHESGAVFTELQEHEATSKRASVMRKIIGRNHQPEVQPLFDLKEHISSPFDFQHISHADRRQFVTLDQTCSESLAAGFQAAHTSQQPSSSLTGIRTNDLRISNFSSEDLSSIAAIVSRGMDIRSAPHSPGMMSQQATSTSQVSASRPSLRLTRSAESFSQPGVKIRSHQHSQSTTGPVRLSSLPTDVADEASAEHKRSYVSRSPRSKRESGIWNQFSLDAVASEPRSFQANTSPTTYVGHALTTPNDIAVQATTPPFSPGLDDVAEEPEPFVHPRDAPQPPVKTPTTPQSPRFDSYFITQCSPRTRTRGSSNSSARSQRQHNFSTRPSSQMSDTLGSSGIVRRKSVRRPSAARRLSNTWRALEDSWEDDIDYIYDNALEADCDLEWGRASMDESFEQPQKRPGLMQTNNEGRKNDSRDSQMLHLDFDEDFGSPSQEFSQKFRTSLLIPRRVPDLEPTSATSASTTGTGLRTPSDIYGAAPRTMGDLPFSPSLLVPHVYKDDKDNAYDDLLSQYEDHTDSHFTLIEPSHSTTSSARSSHVRFSRPSSYDSSLISSAQSFGLWSSPVRRSASSAGSIPDLIPSRRPRRDFSSSLMTDQLSDAVASLKNLGEEKESDDDVTPPGRTLENRTFFPCEDTEGELASENKHDTIEEELKSSLEMALHGSQRNNSEQSAVRKPSVPTFAHHRKQAMSDGAAKLLSTASAAPTKTRNRAASTTQAFRSPMLSLFPIPPRNSPTPNQM